VNGGPDGSREGQAAPIRSQERFCVIVPGYNEGKCIGEVVRGIREHCPDVVVVDDGSTDNTAAEAEAVGAHVLKHETNRGKGIALESGFRYAVEQGYAFVVTMDADGQHDPADVSALVEEYARSGKPVIIGSRMDRAENMPLVRRLTNRFMSWLLSREMKQHVPDTQSGFRLYRADVLGMLATESRGYAAESECLLRLAANGIEIGSVPIRVIYGNEESSINPFKDTCRFFRMLGKWRRENGRTPAGNK